MKYKKIKGKVGSYPTKLVPCCSKCNAELRRFNWGGNTGLKCQGCGMLYSNTKFSEDDFITYEENQK